MKIRTLAIALFFTLAFGCNSEDTVTDVKDVAHDMDTNDFESSSDLSDADDYADLEDDGENRDDLEDPEVDLPEPDTQEPDNGKQEPWEPAECGSLTYKWHSMIPGPRQEGFDAELEAKARRIERTWQTFHADAMGLNTDVSVDIENAEDRELIRQWIVEHDDWDFEAFANKSAQEVITEQHKVAGLYGGVGAAADAFRYAVLRDQGYPCDEVDLARTRVVRAMEGLHTVVAITGAPGVIARGIARKDLSIGQYTTVPLFDDDGNALPLEKNNGTWREDFSKGGQYPNLVWEDSCSRDMYVGWAAAYASVWEVIKHDPTFDQALKDRLRTDALAIAQELRKVRVSGYDLEVIDADGRTTLHGWLNENNIDGQVYIDGIRNGFHASIALGVVAAWVYITEDPDLTTWLYDELLGKRGLGQILLENLGDFVDMGYVSNYSNYNMAFTGLWLASRYIEDLEVQNLIKQALKDQLYDLPGETRQPKEIGYSLYDFVYAAGQLGTNAWSAGDAELDSEAMAAGLFTLRNYPEPPYWDFAKVNCPEAVCDCDNPNVESSECTALDGETVLTVLGCKGRNCDLICKEPLPMTIAPPSNYHWRSNPYQPNRGGNGSTLLPAVDFRIAYWMGRYFRIPND